MDIPNNSPQVLILRGILKIACDDSFLLVLRALSLLSILTFISHEELLSCLEKVPFPKGLVDTGLFVFNTMAMSHFICCQTWPSICQTYCSKKDLVQIWKHIFLKESFPPQTQHWRGSLRHLPLFFFRRHALFCSWLNHLLLKMSLRTSSFSSRLRGAGQYCRDCRCTQSKDINPLLCITSVLCTQASSSQQIWWLAPYVCFCTWMGALLLLKDFTTANIPLPISTGWHARWWSAVMSSLTVEWRHLVCCFTCFIIQH